MNVFSSSYNSSKIENFITSTVALIDPKVVLEIGCQQGKSALLIGKGMSKNSFLYTYDLFSEVYENPPYKETHANKDIAITNLNTADLLCTPFVVQGRGETGLSEVKNIDLLHIDICNHYDNLKPLLEIAAKKVSKTILLEGGIRNKWQIKYNFKPYYFLFYESFLMDWTHITIPENEHNAITILSRKIT